MHTTRFFALAAVGLLIGAADSWIRPVQLRLNPQGAPPATTAAEEARSDAPSNGPGAAASATESTGSPGAASGSPSPASGANAAATDEAAMGVDISVAQSKSLWDQGVQFLDARLKEEFLASRVEGAMHLTAIMFSEASAPKALEFLDPAKPVVIYCGGGDCEASHSVGIRLQQAGFQRIHVMKDGYPAWKSAGHPVESGPDPLDAPAGG